MRVRHVFDGFALIALYRLSLFLVRLLTDELGSIWGEAVQRDTGPLFIATAYVVFGIAARLYFRHINPASRQSPSTATPPPRRATASPQSKRKSR